MSIFFVDFASNILFWSLQAFRTTSSACMDKVWLLLSMMRFKITMKRKIRCAIFAQETINWSSNYALKRNNTVVSSSSNGNYCTQNNYWMIWIRIASQNYSLVLRLELIDLFDLRTFKSGKIELSNRIWTNELIRQGQKAFL